MLMCQILIMAWDYYGLRRTWGINAMSIPYNSIKVSIWCTVSECYLVIRCFNALCTISWSFSLTQGLIITCFVIFQLNSYHLWCLESALVKTNNAEVFICHYCQFFDDGSISQNGGGPLVCIYQIFFGLSLLNNLVYTSHHFLGCYRNMERSSLN